MLGVCRPECIISIHALFAEGDHDRTGQQRRVPPISIHALFAEGDSEVLHVLLCRIQFLSTPSSQRATVVPIPPIKRSAAFLSTPSSQRATAVSFSSTAPMAFLSTPSSQRATGCDRAGVRHRAISIHALFAEGDRLAICDQDSTARFLSTPSSQRATTLMVYLMLDSIIHFYPRPLRRGRRRPVQFMCNFAPHFYPRPLRRGRRARSMPRFILLTISIHALFAEGDCRPARRPPWYRHFYPRPLRRGRPAFARLRP